MNYQDDVETLERDDVDIIEPEDYSVIILNDEVTTFELVIYILKDIFHKSKKEAEELTMKVHVEGKAIAGTYTYDIALTKKNLSEDIAKKYGFPLKLEIERT